MKFCCALTPTNNTVERLRRMLRSFYGSANTPNNMECVLKIDDTNHRTLAALPSLRSEFPNIKSVISPRGLGYDEMGKLIMEAAAASDSVWQFMLDDDAELLGKGWDTQLYEMGHGTTRLDGDGSHFAAQAQYYQLNDAMYQWSGGKPCTPVGLFVPSNFWQDHKDGKLWTPADQCWQDCLGQKGWPVKMLPGIVYWHHHNQRSEHPNDFKR